MCALFPAPPTDWIIKLRINKRRASSLRPALQIPAPPDCKSTQQWCSWFRSLQSPAEESPTSCVKTHHCVSRKDGHAFFSVKRTQRKNLITTTSPLQGQRGTSKLHNLSRCQVRIMHVLPKTGRRPWGACLWAYGRRVFALLVGPGEPLSRAAAVINNKCFRMPLQTESTLTCMVAGVMVMKRSEPKYRPANGIFFMCRENRRRLPDKSF